MNLKTYLTKSSLFFKCSAILLAGFLNGCDMIEYHPYDLDIRGEENINEKNIKIIEEKTKDKDEISFIVISDTQRWYDETEDAVKHINQLDGVDFVLHTGDISDFGLRMEFELQRDILNKLKVPYVVVLGNHDCLGTGKAVFNKIFGKDNFAFSAGFTRIVCLNTNALEFDHTEAVPDFNYIKEELEYTKGLGDKITKTVVAMHSGPNSEQFNPNAIDIFHPYIKQFPNLQFCVYGHWHNFAEDNFYDDDITYFECTCAKKRGLLRFTINKNEKDYKHERIIF